MGLKTLAMVFPPIRRLYEDRARLRAKLREARVKQRAQRARLDALRKQRAELIAELDAKNSQRLVEPPLHQLVDRLKRDGIDLVLDVGASDGIFAGALRSAGFDGEIVSFEPLSGPFAALRWKCDHDEHWSCHNVALGDEHGEAVINVSQNSVSSSLLPVHDWTVKAEPGIAYVARETVAVRRLDALLPQITDARRVFLKIDTQGFESRVLDGARGVMDRIVMVQLELAWKPGYEGQAELGTMLVRMNALGLEPALIMPGWTDRSGALREFDLVFARVGVES